MPQFWLRHPWQFIAHVSLVGFRRMLILSLTSIFITNGYSKDGSSRKRNRICRSIDIMSAMKYWEIIAGKLSTAGCSWSYPSAVREDDWRWIVDAHKGDGRRYVVHSDELLSALPELEVTLL